MSSPVSQKIVIIGAGRLAAHLGVALYRHGLNIVQVYNRTAKKGKTLASRVGASFTSDIQSISSNADIYFLAVSDSALDEFAEVLRLKDRLVVHTSGTVAMSVLAPVSTSTGVLYPVQTFSPGRRVDFRNIPVCIEGNSKAAEDRLADLARILSQSVFLLDTEKRQVLHLAAVFASNFTNFLYAVTGELLDEHDIPFGMIRPLIYQTARNINYGDLRKTQTGPAVRGDITVLRKHRELLKDHPDYLQIYNLISENIIKHRNVHG